MLGVILQLDQVPGDSREMPSGIQWDEAPRFCSDSLYIKCLLCKQQGADQPQSGPFYGFMFVCLDCGIVCSLPAGCNS